MKPKIFTLYAAGIALLIAAAGCGDGFNTLPANAWGGNLALCITFSIGGIFCLAHGRSIEMELANRRRQREARRAAYQKHRKDA